MQLNPSFRDRILLGTNPADPFTNDPYGNVVQQSHGVVQVLDGLVTDLDAWAASATQSQQVSEPGTLAPSSLTPEQIAILYPADTIPAQNLTPEQAAILYPADAPGNLTPVQAAILNPLPSIPPVFLIGGLLLFILAARR